MTYTASFVSKLNFLLYNIGKKLYIKRHVRSKTSENEALECLHWSTFWPGLQRITTLHLMAIWQTIQFLHWQIASMKISVKLSSLWAEAFKVSWPHPSERTFQSMLSWRHIKMFRSNCHSLFLEKKTKLFRSNFHSQIHSANKYAGNRTLHRWFVSELILPYIPFDLTRTRYVGLFKTCRRDLQASTTWWIRALISYFFFMDWIEGNFVTDGAEFQHRMLSVWKTKQ